MILLIQFRSDQSGWHEFKCIYDALPIPAHEYKLVNVLSPFVTERTLREDFRRADKIILGGSGELGWEVYESQNKRAVGTFNRLLKKIGRPLKKLVVSDQKPILGMCFGYQLIAHVLGCDIQVDKKQIEVGIFTLRLNQSGRQSPLFKKMNSSFKAVLAHKGSVVKTVADPRFKLLASTKKCSAQAFQYGKNTYGVQFHPELNYDDLMFRLALFPSYKQKEKVVRQKIAAKQVLRNFLSL